jgi:ABC-type antimicrobial peptide transport system permease subunit
VKFTRFRFLLAGLKHYWRSHLAVALGTAIAAAVLAGALIVGDSVRASLKAMTLDRLGAVDYAVTGPRFVREKLVDDLAADASLGVRVAPAIQLTGALETSSGDQHRRAGGVNVVACDQRLFDFLDHGSIETPATDAIVLSRRVADQLQVQVGDAVSVFVEIPQTIPRDALLGDREQTVTELLLTVSAIADESLGLARFGMNPSQQLPAIAFVNLKQVQEQLGVGEVAKSRTNPYSKPARINSLFFSQGDAVSDAVATARNLTARLHQSLQLSDLHLRLVEQADRHAVSLESEQMLLDPRVVQRATDAGKQIHRAAAPVLVYLLNEISNEKHPDRKSMYAVAAGVEPAAFAVGKGEKLKPEGAAEVLRPEVDAKSRDVVINDWLATDLDAAVGDVLTVKYHQVGDRGELPEIAERFAVRAIVPLSPPWDDQGLVPFVPGITDADSFRDWRQPFPMKMDEITDRDEQYWKAHRATPKILLPLSAARDLWRSRYGDATSLRYFADGETTAELMANLEQTFVANLNPEVTGLLAQPVKAQGLQAASGTTDFAALFLGFSFFLIGAAAILIALLFRLSVEQRIRQLGLLTAVGWSPTTVFRMAIAEAMCVVSLGAVLGLPLAIGYAAVMIYGLKTWWNAAVGTQFLFLSVQLDKLIFGAVAAIVVAAISVWLGLRSARKVSPRAMLAGEVEVQSSLRIQRSRLRTWLVPLVCGGLAVAILLSSVAGVVPTTEAFEGLSWTIVAFFLCGMLLLVAGMTAFSAMLRERPAASHRRLTAPRLAFRNSARNTRRSTLTAGIVSSAAFLVAAVASGRRDPLNELPDRQTGNGGFLLIGETATPVLYDLNTSYGRAQLGIDEVNPLWSSIHVVPMRVQPGENASCLNLYQTVLPTILALPDDAIRAFADEQRFKFIGQTPRKAWPLLLAPAENGIVPVLGDVNTLQYSLHKAVGDQIPLDDAPTRRGQELAIAGMFDSSIFQGVLVMSESNFLRLYPERAGFQQFLIESPNIKTVDEARAQAESISDLLETQLRDYGFDAERVSVRLADFLAVQNTYLATFQTLGGLGMLLGVFGLFAVMLRNIVERRGELALLRAVGLSDSQTGRIVILENLMLVGWGLATGIGAALLAMAPHLLSSGGSPPWQGLIVLAASVLMGGLIAVWIALRGALRTPIVAALRDE